MTSKTILVTWIAGMFAVCVSGISITVCPSQIPSTPCQVICESADFSQPVTIKKDGNSIGVCLADGTCYTTATGYDPPHRIGTNQTVLNISAYDRTRDPGVWLCSAGVNVSPSKTMHYAIPPTSATITPNNHTVNSTTQIIVTTDCAYINISGIIKFEDTTYSQNGICTEVPSGGCSSGTGEKYTCIFALNPGDMPAGTYVLEFKVDLPYDDTNPKVNLTTTVYITFPESDKYCKVPDILRRNLARGKTDMTTKDTSCMAVCPVTIVVTEIVILIVTAIVVYLICDTICSNFRCFVYICVAINTSTVIIASIISGGIVGKLREDGFSGYCCEVNVVVLSAVIPVVVVTICVGIVALILIMKFGNDKKRIHPKKSENNEQDHKNKTIRTFCAQLTCKVTSVVSFKSDEQPPGATERQTSPRVSLTGISVTDAGSSGKKKLPPIENQKVVANKSDNQNDQPTEPTRSSIVQTSDNIKKLKPKSKKNKTSKNINQQQQQTASENKFDENLEKSIDNQTNENSLASNQTINKHTYDGDVSRDEREKKKSEQNTNEKHEDSSQKTETDKASKNINQQQQQTTSENKSNENLERKTNNQTNENSLPLNQFITNHTHDGDVNREKKRSVQQTNEKHEDSSQKTETDKENNAKNKSQNPFKPNKIADNVGQTSHNQKQINTEGKSHEKHKSTIDTPFEKQELSTHSTANVGKNDQINLGKKANQILQNNDLIKESEINSEINEMANKQGTTAHEQQRSVGKTGLHEKQDKAIKNQANVENMPDKTGDPVPSDLSNSIHSSHVSEKEKGDMQSDQ